MQNVEIRLEHDQAHYKRHHKHETLLGALVPVITPVWVPLPRRKIVAEEQEEPVSKRRTVPFTETYKPFKKRLPIQEDVEETVFKKRSLSFLYHGSVSVSLEVDGTSTISFVANAIPAPAPQAIGTSSAHVQDIYVPGDDQRGRKRVVPAWLYDIFSFRSDGLSSCNWVADGQNPVSFEVDGTGTCSWLGSAPAYIWNCDGLGTVSFIPYQISVYGFEVDGVGTAVWVNVTNSWLVDAGTDCLWMAGVPAGYNSTGFEADGIGTCLFASSSTSWLVDGTSTISFTGAQKGPGVFWNCDGVGECNWILGGGSGTLCLTSAVVGVIAPSGNYVF